MLKIVTVIVSILASLSGHAQFKTHCEIKVIDSVGIQTDYRVLYVVSGSFDQKGDVDLELVATSWDKKDLPKPIQISKLKQVKSEEKTKRNTFQKNDLFVSLNYSDDGSKVISASLFGKKDGKPVRLSGVGCRPDLNHYP